MEYSYISGTAIKVGSDIFEFFEDGELLINGESDTPSAGMVFEGVQSISKRNKGSRNRIIAYKMDLADDKSIEVRVNTKVGMLFVDVNGAFVDSEGLLGGAFEDGKPLLARDGETDLTGHWNTYGEEWQVKDADPKLFQDKDRHPQYPEICLYKADRKHSYVRGSRRRLLDTAEVTLEAANKACSNAKDSVKKAFCVDDVLATRDLEIAEDSFYH